ADLPISSRGAGVGPSGPPRAGCPRGLASRPTSLGFAGPESRATSGSKTSGARRPCSDGGPRRAVGRRAAGRRAVGLREERQERRRELGGGLQGGVVADAVELRG